MEAQISISGVDGQKQLESLESWLRVDPSFRGRTNLDGIPAEGDLGTGIELLTVAIGGGGVLSVLLASLNGWLQQPRKLDIILKVTGPTGATVEIDAKRTTSEEIAELLNRALEATQEPSA
ncbi:hypothetical protein OHB35_24145 [Streptomyces phaeochromogenes]|uniref:Uncharacterized protein n=1 Tax=Streptomyces phaeochromogenes TaxID=1923 RepID=A0ABZ1HBX5_STRPH|nr:hypothetical protein [Streptomyces phaeochromogenes]WSD16092.1 hypothetical protein OHB35_24145 [Streptomyces phaeochromogenes]